MSRIPKKPSDPITQILAAAVDEQGIVATLRHRVQGRKWATLGPAAKATFPVLVVTATRHARTRTLVTDRPVKELALMAGLSVRSVQYGLRELEGDGWIKRLTEGGTVGTSKQPARYQIFEPPVSAHTLDINAPPKVLAHVVWQTAVAIGIDSETAHNRIRLALSPQAARGSWSPIDLLRLVVRGDDPTQRELFHPVQPVAPMQSVAPGQERPNGKVTPPHPVRPVAPMTPDERALANELVGAEHDAVDTLVALGCGRREARKLVQATRKTIPNRYGLDEIVRQALVLRG